MEHSIPLKYYWAVILLGLILGCFGALYNKTIDLMQDIFEYVGKGISRFICRITGKDYSIISDGLHPTIFASRAAVFGRMLAIFFAAYVLFFLYPDALGSGSFLVSDIGHGKYGLYTLLILLVIKFIYSTASFGSGSPGGIFLPLLVIGSITGGLFSRVLGLAGFDQSYIEGFVVIAMAGYFAAIVRAPVTGVVLITEMTGDFTTLLPLVLTSLVAYLVAEALGVVPIYTQLLERNLKKQGTGRRSRTFDSLRERKAVVDVEVYIGSRMDGSHVSEFRLPPGTLIISVIREGVEIIPDGNTYLRGGDKLEILTREADIPDVEIIADEACHKLV
jgi:H+/Cl- antiporter ClcA